MVRQPGENAPWKRQFSCPNPLRVPVLLRDTRRGAGAGEQVGAHPFLHPKFKPEIFSNTGSNPQ